MHECSNIRTKKICKKGQQTRQAKRTDYLQALLHRVTQKKFNVPCFLNIYIDRLNWDVSNLFAVEDPLIYILLLVKISNDWNN